MRDEPPRGLFHETGHALLTSPLEGVVEKSGPGSERVPFVLHGHRIDFTLSSRRRRRIEGRSPSTRSRCAPALPRYGARARLLGMREECRRGSNASDECQTEQGARNCVPMCFSSMDYAIARSSFAFDPPPTRFRATPLLRRLPLKGGVISPSLVGNTVQVGMVFRPILKKSNRIGIAPRPPRLPTRPAQGINLH